MNCALCGESIEANFELEQDCNAPRCKDCSRHSRYDYLIERLDTLRGQLSEAKTEQPINLPKVSHLSGLISTMKQEIEETLTEFRV